MFNRFLCVFILLIAAPQSIGAEPRLVLLLAVDQLRPDRLNEAMPGGLGRLMREGRVYLNATLDHGVTNTCPGHVVMSTGVNPGKAGISGNSFIDHSTLKQRYCVDDTDEAYRVHGATEIRSPRAITATTLGDWLKAVSPDSRVFAVSGKDRSAITLGGHKADGAYWYSRTTGSFTSSGYYGYLPAYIDAFNGTDVFSNGYAAANPSTWLHGPGSVRADDYQGEARLNLRYSGHPLNTGEPPERIVQLYASPFLDQATARLATIVLEEEALGQRGVTDLLAISFSAVDVVGHRYGPFSAESEDTLARLDTELDELLKALDEKFGDAYVLALSADHGVQPLPEWLSETGQMTCPVDDGRLEMQGTAMGLYWYLYRKFTLPFSNPMKLVAFSESGVTVNAAMAAELRVSVQDIIAAMETYLEQREYVAAAWTIDEIQQSDDPVARLYRNSYVPGKSPHLFIQLEENCIVYASEGTTHGSIYDHDRKIPLIFFGASVQPGHIDAEQHSIDIAPTLGAGLGLPLPSDLDGQVLDIWVSR